MGRSPRRSEAPLRSRRRRPAARRPEDLLLIGFIIFGAVIAAVAIVVILDDDGSSETHVDSTQLVHVHGLGINPADGKLYAAAHSGLFRIDGRNDAVRIADRYQDTMAFTVAGPDRFLASGHPDLREADEGAPLLGLIESTDAGESWKSLSLRGESDFHSLALVDDEIIGYDSVGTRIMVTADGIEWETRSEIPLRDLSVNPDNSTQMAALDVDGQLLRSVDGGRTWTDDLAAPRAGAVVRWGSAGIWIGGADGVLHHETDNGWLIVARYDSQVDAILIDGDELYVATMSDGIVHSADGGRTWELRSVGAD